jgi:adenylosuccinate lyase
MRAWQDRRPLLDLLAADPEVTAHLDRDQLAALFDLAQHVKEVDRIFERVFGDDAAR